MRSPNDSDSNAASDGSSSGRPVISGSRKSADERSSGDDDVVDDVVDDDVDDDEDKEGDAKHHEDHDGNCDHDACRAHDQNGASGL